MSDCVSGWFTRRAIMQGVLLLIASGTFIAATEIQRHAAGRLSVKRGPVQRVGPVLVPSPAGWAVQRTQDGVIFIESASRGGRTLEVRHTSTLMLRSPIERLMLEGILGPAERPGGLRNIGIGGVHPGIWPAPAVWVYGGDNDIPREGARAVRRGDAHACAPAGISEAIILGLTDRRRELASNRWLAWGIAKEVRFVEPPFVSASEPDFRLAYDMSVRVNTGCMVDRPDRLSISRMVVFQDRPSWQAAELVPCVVSPGTAERFIVEAFKVRNPAIAPPKAESPGGNTWVCRAERTATTLGVFLRTYGDGRALLADIRCDCREPVPASCVDEAWRWCGNAMFGDGFPVQEAFDAGRQNSSRLMPDIAQWPADGESETRWQAYHDSSPRNATVVCAVGRRGDFIEGLDRWERPGTASGEGVIRRWRMSADASAYRCEVSSAYDGAVRRCIFDGRRINGEWRLTETSPGEAPASHPSESRRENFVPGVALPVFLGRAPYERMVLTTESLPEPTTGVLAGPFVLLVEPAFDMPRHLPGHLEPMRCWAVNVGGTGWSSRWYYDSDGRLRAITYPGGRHMHIMTPDAPSTAPAAR